MPAALSFTTREAVRVPTACGSKVTDTVHDEETARVVAQLFVSAKSPAPLIPIDEMSSVAPPVFLMTTGCATLVEFTAWLANVSDVGVKIGTGPPLPVPVRATVCVVVLLGMVTLAEIDPLALGSKVM